MAGRKPRLDAQIAQVKLFQAHVVEGKSVTESAEIAGVTRRMAHNYKNQEEFRTLALAWMEDSDLQGLKGTLSRLVGMLDATKSVFVKQGRKTVQETVPDNDMRMKTLQELIKIYGLHAPKRTNVKVDVTLSSDAQLYSAIEQAERTCRVVTSHTVGTKREGLADGERSDDPATAGSRTRTLLHDEPVSEQVGRFT